MQKFHCLWLILACFIFSSIIANGEEKKIITVKDLNTLKVVGRLGIALGELITIEGRVATKEEYAYKERGKLGIVIDKINNEKIDPVILEMLYMPAKSQDDWPTGRIHCFGYESGAFSGNPKGINYMTNHRFCFRTFFVALKDVKAD